MSKAEQKGIREGVASEARCNRMPNDAEDGHYWAWCNSPQSVPSQFRKCMVCDRIDASEAIKKEIIAWRIEQWRRAKKYMLNDVWQPIFDELCALKEQS